MARDDDLENFASGCLEHIVATFSEDHPKGKHVVNFGTLNGIDKMDLTLWLLPKLKELPHAYSIHYEWKDHHETMYLYVTIK